MPYSAIPTSDIDLNSPLKTGVVMTKLRDNPEFVADGSAATKYQFPDAGRATERCLLTPDGIGGVAGTPFESRAPVVQLFNGSWIVPAGVFQVVLEAWGGGTGNVFSGGIRSQGSAGGWCWKLVDVTPGDTISFTVGAGTAADAAFGAVAGDTVVTHIPSGTTLTAKGGKAGQASGASTGGQFNEPSTAGYALLGASWRGGGWDAVGGAQVPGGPGNAIDPSTGSAGAQGAVHITAVA
jgi:hypothetical protein